MSRHVTSIRRLAALLGLACCELVLRAVTKVVDRMARIKPEGDNWQDEEVR